MQEAIRSGRTLLADLIRSRGGKLPGDVAAVQMCSAASKGDLPALKLLHLCGVNSDIGDYDYRCPLHLAAAEARLLAVSFLLVIGANPNCAGGKCNLFRAAYIHHLLYVKLNSTHSSQIDGATRQWMRRSEEGQCITSTALAYFMHGEVPSGQGFELRREGWTLWKK